MSNVYRAYLSTKLEAGGSETTIYVDRMTNLLGETISYADFANLTRGVLTVNPDGNGQDSYPEYISFTGISGNTFTGAIRGLSGHSDTPSSSLKRFHPVGTPVTFSFGYHNIRDLMDYTDEVLAEADAAVGTTTLAIAGENLTAPNIIYLKNDGTWWKARADDPSTIYGVELGICQTDTTAGASITKGAVLMGRRNLFSGLSVGTTYYVSDTPGAISSTPGTFRRAIGVGTAATDLIFNPYYDYDQTPAGTIKMFGSSTAPSGYLNCDGSAISRTTYARLFAVISTTYGVGNGSTTFNLPALNGRFPLGYSAAAPTKVFTFASRSSNVITVTGADNHAHNEIQTGQAVLYTAASGAMTGLTHNTTYYLIRVSATTFSLASSRANAIAGTVIALSSDGTGTQTFTITYTARPMGQTGGEEEHSLVTSEIPAHTHTFAQENGAGAAATLTANKIAGATSASGSTGGSTSHNIMPLSQVVNFVIKV